MAGEIKDISITGTVPGGANPLTMAHKMEVARGSDDVSVQATLDVLRRTVGAHEAHGAKPLAADFTSVGSTMTFTDGVGGLDVSATANGSAAIGLIVKTAPAAPFDFVARIDQFGSDVTNFAGIGIVVRNSTNSRFLLHYLHSNTGIGIDFERWTNSTTFSAGTTGSTVDRKIGFPATWFRLNVTSTTVTAYFSNNGLDWHQKNLTAAEAISSFLTASGGGSLDQIGIGIRRDNAYQRGIVSVFQTSLPTF